MKKLLPGMAVCMALLCTLPLFAQKQSLFNADDTDYDRMDAAQQHNYRILQQNPNLKAIYLFTLNDLSAVQEKGKVRIDLPYLPCRDLVFHVNHARYTADDDYDWNGEVIMQDESDSLCSDGFLTLVHHKAAGGLMGTLTLRDFDAEIQDLTGGLKALVVLDQAQLRYHRCGNKPTGPEPGPPPNGGQFNEDCLKKDLRVLVLYSPAAADNMTVNYLTGNPSPNLYLNAYFSVYKMNATLQNSKVYREVILAGVETLPGHVEAYDSETELISLVADNYVDNLRNQYKADAVVEFIENDFNDAAFPASITNPRIYGRTRNIGAYNPANGQLDRDYAYLLVNVNHNYPNMTFTHEMGHLLGGRHDDDNEDIYYLDANAHARHFTRWWGPFPTGYYRTASSSRSLVSFRTVIPYYSNPQQDYSGIATGAPGQNNAYRINAHFRNIAGFYTDGPVGFQNFVSTQQVSNPIGPGGQVPPCPYHTVLTAQTNGCTALSNLSHQWAISYDGITWQDMGGGNSLSLSHADNGTILVRLTTTASGPGASSITASSTAGVLFYGCGGTGNSSLNKAAATNSAVAAADFSLYPNPIAADGQFALAAGLPEAQAADIRLYDVYGRQAALLYKGRLAAGYSLLYLQAPLTLSKGLYVVKIKYGSQSRQLKLLVP